MCMKYLEGFLREMYPVIQKQVVHAQKDAPLEEMKKKAESRIFPVVDLKERIIGHGSPMAVIAEIKRASPNKSIISDRDILSQVEKYIEGGAEAVSVLTEPNYFHGSLGDLHRLKSRFPDVPFLRKDFIIFDYQVYQSKAAGADAVLLITQWLEDDDLNRLYELTRSLGMNALVEVESKDDMDRALSAGFDIIGINARSLVDLSVHVERVSMLANHAKLNTGAIRELPILVGESGVDSAKTVVAWSKAGINAILVGEALMKADEPGSLIRDFSMIE